jgi:hypothetical protein
MAKNLREIKANLAKAFPDVRFTYDTAGRGCSKGPRVSWTGGPTPDELAAIKARQAREHAEWLADAPNREAQIAEKRRLGAPKAAWVRKAIARYPLALADAGCRRNHLSAQIALPIELPRRRAA